MVDILKPNILGESEPDTSLEFGKGFIPEGEQGFEGAPAPETLPQDIAPELPTNFVAEFSGMDIEEQRKLLLDSEVGSPLFQQITDATEQTKFLNDLKEDFLLIAQLFQEGKIPEDSPDFNTAQQIFLVAEPYIKPAADIAALTFGGIIGAPAGPIGAVGGAGLAFGIERSFFKMVEGLLGLREPQGIVREAQEAIVDVGEGAAFEIGGQAIAPVLKGVGGIVKKRVIDPVIKRSTLTAKGATQRASDIIKQEVKGTSITQPQIDRNVKIANDLQAKIRATKGIGAEDFTFTLGQITDDASAIALERTLARRKGLDLTQAQRQNAVEILRQYYHKKVLSTGTIEDLPSYIIRLDKALSASTKEATDAVNSEVLRLRRHLDPQVIGKNIFNKLSASRKALDDEVGALFEKIPNFKVNPEIFLDKIAKITSERLPKEPTSFFPTEAVELILASIKTPVKEVGKKPISLISVLGGKSIAKEPEAVTRFITIKNLRGINQSLNDMIGQASREGKRTLSRRLKILKKGVDDILKQAELEGKGEGVEILREANALRTSVGERFDKSTVADIFQRGARGEETRIAKANIAKEFDSLDGIDDLIAAIDSVPAAKSMMGDYYAFKLVNAAVDAEGVVGRKKAANWLLQNRSKLKKLGLEEEFSGLANMQSKVDAAIAKQNVFNKSVAGRILEADIDSMISNAFRGSKNIAQTSRDLLEMVKGDKAATLGLKKSFAEFLTRKVESTAPSFFQAIGGTTPGDVEFLKSMSKMNKVFREFQPAIKAMYKDEPQKIQAINDVWESFRILERTAKSSVGAGSPTAELIFRGNSLGRAGGIAVGGVAPKRFYIFKVVRDWIQAFGQKNVEQYLTKAMFDPEYAAVMTKEVRFGSTQAGRSTIKRLMRNGPVIVFDPPRERDTNRRTNR